MSLVVVAAIIGARRRLVLHRRRRHRTGRLARAALHREGRPRHDELRAAAGLVLLLPLLPAADLQVAGLGRSSARSGSRRSPDPADRAAVLRPPHGAAPLRRPVAIIAAILVVLSMGVLTYKGATAKESLRSEAIAAVPNWVEHSASPTTRGGAGRGDLRAVGLPQLPHLPRQRLSNLGAPDLSSGGREGQGHPVPDRPSQVPVVRQPRLPMPPFEALGDENLQQARDLPRGVQGRRSSADAPRAHLPRHNRRLRRPLCGTPAPGARRRRLRGRPLRVDGRDRGARDRALRPGAPLPRRDARAVDRGARRARHDPRPATGARRTRAARRRSTAT